LGAENLGAYFSRFLLAVDFAPGFEARAARADPLVRYAAFVADTIARLRAGPTLRAHQSDLWRVLRSEEIRLQATHPDGWAAGMALRDEIG
jgi:hypothetical protein